ncbi:MAG: hypothetical protein Q4B36_07355, partial [Tissierellia bacterium]|nr:hypothetical protein [Tissierellia bacterium]
EVSDTGDVTITYKDDSTDFISGDDLIYTKARISGNTDNYKKDSIKKSSDIVKTGVTGIFGASSILGFASTALLKLKRKKEEDSEN